MISGDRLSSSPQCTCSSRNSSRRDVVELVERRRKLAGVKEENDGDQKKVARAAKAMESSLLIAKKLNNRMY